MKRVLFLALLFVSVFASAQEDYEFLLMSSPSLSQEYPKDNRIMDDGGTYRSFSYDGKYAFIYCDKRCGFYLVPAELEDGFRSMVPNLQKTNASLFWQRVKKVMADIDAYWNNLDSLENVEVPDTVVQQSKSGSGKVFDVVESMPTYPGGMGALMQYLSSNIKYPTDAEKNGIQGRVITTFVVEKDGSITDVRVTKSIYPSLDKEAIRVVSKMPKWIPGKQNGSVVRVKYTLPLTFRLQ